VPYRKVVVMNILEVGPGIVICNNVIPNSENLYKEIEEQVALTEYEWQPISVKTEETVSVDKNLRDTDAILIPYEGKVVDSLGKPPVTNFLNNINNIFFESFDPIEKKYMSTYGYTFPNHEDYTILRYGVGQHFENHIDDHPNAFRRVSTVYFLNDGYEGGEIKFPRFNVTIKPKANQMVLFPSTYTYNHLVKPVTKGTRYSVVSWIS
jgi:hypothetical protein